MITAIEKQSPIVTAILGQALLEGQLDQMLRSRFARMDDGTWAKLTDPPGPLSSFNAKILLGHAFKLYDDTFASNLHIVRTIGNAFAHTKKLITFDHALIAEELRSIKLPLAKRSDLYKSLKKVKRLDIQPQASYAILCLSLYNNLLKRSLRTSQAKTGRLSKRLKRAANAQYRGLAGALLGYPLGEIEGSLQSSRPDQSDNPTPQAPNQNLYGLCFKRPRKAAKRADESLLCDHWFDSSSGHLLSMSTLVPVFPRFCSANENPGARAGDGYFEGAFAS